MHHILKPTELKRLRELGFEVFNPAYISPVFDQSADTSIDHDQPTTLPDDVFRKLLAHDFFYTDVPPDIAEILNTYFDFVIVTIHADWLRSIVRVFDGTIIYRVYGQPWSLAEQMVTNGVWRLLIGRGNVHIVPFSAESVEHEHPWFLDLCTHIVPYQIPDDVFAYTGSWGQAVRRNEIATNIPNIQDPYYGAVYHHFVQAYRQKYIRIYGPQRALPADPRILGKLSRDVFLKRLAESAGYLYPYTDNVCYLPPIEMMQIGGPVLYAPGSLLARFGETDAPGLVADPAEADAKFERLLAHDKAFIADILAAQEPIRQRYDRAVVRPAFDEAFLALLAPDSDRPKEAASQPVTLAAPRDRPKIAILLHYDGLYTYVRGKPSAFEGIPRVVASVVDAIVAQTDADVIVTCTPASEPVMRDVFRDERTLGRLTVQPLVFDPDADEVIRNGARLNLMAQLNRDPQVKSVFVPHYYLFPESLLLDRAVTLYLPDYFPHLLPDEVFDANIEKDRENRAVGTAIAQKAARILTNSHFTKGYLPDAGFAKPEEADKIVVAPLPLLGRKRAVDLTERERIDMRRRIGDRPFVFYPTANRPNKKLAFFMRLLAYLHLETPDLCAVLTCNLNDVPGVSQAADDYGVRDRLVFMPGMSEGTLRWCYENAVALCLTSVAEGNFPPQVLEALNYGTPVVTTRLPTIVEVAGPQIDKLLTCDPLNLVDFADKFEIATKQRSQTIRNQNDFLQYIEERSSIEAFTRQLVLAFPDVFSQTAGEFTSRPLPHRP